MKERLIRMTNRAAMPKAEEPKKATLMERHAAMQTAEDALSELLAVLEHEDRIDQSLGQIVAQCLANVQARRLNESRIAGLALGGKIVTRAEAVEIIAPFLSPDGTAYLAEDSDAWKKADASI